jgi:thiamine biosynthesis lipoprotein
VTAAVTTSTRVEHVMGTAFSLTSTERGPTVDAAFDAAFSWLRWVDATFSTYRLDSEVCRIDRGELSFDDAAPEVREVLVRCDELTAATDGWFRARADDGRLDPSGLVKGWSIDLAAQLLRMAGLRSFAVNGGGDIVCEGASPSGGAWRTGIRHPHEVGSVAAVLDLTGHAIATSGTYERGAHIWRRPSDRGRPDASVPPLASVTVVGPELGIADALATAIFAEGSGAPAWLGRFPGYEVLLVTMDDRVRWTPGLDPLKVAA